MSLAAVTALGIALAGPPDGGGADVHYVDASLEPDGEILAVELVDLEGDGREEVCLALRPRAGGRELAFFRIEDERIPAEPFRVVPVLDDTLACGFADVRPEPGRELVFLTSDGAWSYSLAHDGYRGNVRRLAEAELVYDVPDPRELSFWRYVLPCEGGDRILLPGRSGYSVWGPAPGAEEEEESPYVPARRHDAVEAAFRRGGDDRRRGSRARRDRTEVRLGPEGLRVVRERAPVGGLLLSDEPRFETLLEVQRSYAAPALVDVDGDGHLDLLALAGDELRVHLADASGDVPDVPSRVETLPAYLAREDGERRLELADLDGDGDPDLLARLSPDDDRIENGEITLYVLINDGGRLLPDEPDQILRFEAAELRVHVTDVDGDGRPDLAIREFEMPSLIDAVTGPEFTLTHLLFLGERGPRPFARKPALKQAQVFDETTLRDAIKNRALSMDCDGDGIADLVEIDLEGRIAIRRLTRTKGFFGGGSWSLEETPWVRFDAFGDVSSIDVRDLNGDGLGDVVSRGEKALTVLLSVREAR